MWRGRLTIRKPMVKQNRLWSWWKPWWKSVWKLTVIRTSVYWSEGIPRERIRTRVLQTWCSSGNCCQICLLSVNHRVTDYDAAQRTRRKETVMKCFDKRVRDRSAANTGRVLQETSTSAKWQKGRIEAKYNSRAAVIYRGPPFHFVDHAIEMYRRCQDDGRRYAMALWQSLLVYCHTPLWLLAPVRGVVRAFLLP